MKTNILKISALAAALMLSQLSEAQKNFFVKVENIKNVNSVKQNPIVYSLPKTVLSVKVTAVNEISVKGPYSQYAQKYLGTDEVINANSSSWSISSVEISSYPVKDSLRTFVVESNYPCAMNFTCDGFLESVNTASDYKEDDRRNIEISNFQTDNFQSGKIFQDINVNRYETVFDSRVGGAAPRLGSRARLALATIKHNDSRPVSPRTGICYKLFSNCSQKFPKKGLHFAGTCTILTLQNT